MKKQQKDSMEQKPSFMKEVNIKQASSKTDEWVDREDIPTNTIITT